jgi:L-ascorbate metabolism protein UlaG (beta-lactamase superfamily)
MHITKYIHSCLLIQDGNDNLLFDPGKFSFAEKKVRPGDFTNVLAIVLTHYHPDHIDEKALKTIIENNPGVEVLVNSEIHEKLAAKEIGSRVFETGTLTLGPFTLDAFDAPHEKLLADSIPQNTAYIVNGILLHPGDSLSDKLYAHRGIKILALPLMAPWATELQIYEFAVKMAPEMAVPIHDGFAKDFFLDSRYDNFEKFLKQENIQFRRMGKPGDSISV